MNITFIIQARLGSTRLPGKILLPFWRNQSILDLLIEKLKQIPNSRIILATSESPQNNPLEEIANSKHINIYRGNETDVLQRFIDAADKFNANQIIRICSDNPFLELKSIQRLIEFINIHPQYDYVSFNVNGTPSIKTHYGFWTEFVTLNALKKVCSLTDEPLYHEHVTNFIYTHPEHFNFHLLDTPSILTSHDRVRLTIDTETDFTNAQSIYNELNQQTPYPSIEDIIGFLDSHPSYYQTMQQEIAKNSK